MQSVTLATSHFLKEFHKELNHTINDFALNGVEILSEEQLKGKIYIWQLKFLKDELNSEVNEKCATSICNFIIKYWEKELLYMILTRYYERLSKPEQDYIYAKALSKIRDLDNISLYSKDSFRKNKMREKILCFLEETGYLNLDGFVQFGNKEYLEELRSVVDTSVEEFYLDQEFSDFVNLLKSLIEWQESKVENIHVVFLPSGGFQIFFNRDKILDKNYLDGFLLDCEEDVVNYDDLLISSLINISPQNVILHLNTKHQYSDMLNIIMQVFENRVQICEGCERCQRLLNSKKN